MLIFRSLTNLFSNDLGEKYMIQNFKSISTRKINAQRAMSGVPVWQRNYWERIVRNESELGHIRQYIVNNPRRWAFDRANPQPRPA